jgi:hypothetical protein
VPEVPRWQHDGVRSIPGSGFEGDTGAADPALVRALTRYDRAPDRLHHPTLAVLQDCRLLVPVVAVLGEVEHDEHGRARDKTSDMAAVLLTGRDGRTALLAFSGTGSLHRWNRDARPVPVTARTAARAAVQDGADALVVDVAGPVLLAVEGEDLRALADGYRLAEVGGRAAWVRPDAPTT